MTAVVGAGVLLLTDPGRRLLEDVTGRAETATGPTDTVTVAGAGSEQPLPVDQGSVPGITSPLESGRGRTPASDLVTGSCYDSTVAEGADGTLDVTSVTERDCWGPHENQALAVVTLEADRTAGYPGADALMDTLALTCERAQERVLGPDPGAEWAFATVYPSPDSWAAGDRQAICEVSLRDGSLLESPLAEPPRGSAG